MRSHLLSAAIFFVCSSFLNDGYPGSKNSLLKNIKANKSFDLTVHRLSGERVIIAWHTEGDSERVIYEVLRKHKIREQFIPLGIASPELKRGNTADYSFVDANNFFDSSYYCLKTTNEDSVTFYSITIGIAGVQKKH